MRLFIFLFPILFSCIGSQSTLQSEITEIRWGKSFGMCRGYCYSEYQYTAMGSKLIRKSWDAENNPPIIEEYPAKPGQWSDLKASVSVSKIGNLPDQIGCPDCADGGAEWVEIITSEKSKKVTYEYGSTPAGLEGLLGLLRGE